MKNIIEIFKMPTTNNSEILTKKDAYLDLLEESIETENYELTDICKENVDELKTLLK